MKSTQYGLYGQVDLKNARGNVFLRLGGVSNNFWSGFEKKGSVLFF
jgi:hypothetical protein